MLAYLIRGGNPSGYKESEFRALRWHQWQENRRRERIFLNTLKEEIMAQIIISTCGTSLLTNGASSELKSMLRENANAKENELTSDDKHSIDERLQEQRSFLLKYSLTDIDEIRRSCAELNGLLGVLGEGGKRESADMHMLVHTDTYQGEHVASLLSEWCKKEGVCSQLVPVDALNTRSLTEFHEGIGNLMKWCQSTLPGYRTSGFKIIFNLVGGFKSLQGYMQTLGMLFADESVYVFEGQRELLRIPRLPLDIDSSCRDMMKKNLRLFRRLSRNFESISRAKCASLPDTFFYCVEDECILSDWGTILWEKFKEDAYREALQPSPSNKLRISEGINKEVSNLDALDVFRVNEKIDDLALYLEKGNNLKSLSFKKLAGNPVPGRTHEFYLWSDRDAARGFGKYDGPVFVFEHMSPHLK